MLLPRFADFGRWLQSTIVNQPQTATHTESDNIEHPFSQAARLNQIQNHQNTTWL